MCIGLGGLRQDEAMSGIARASHLVHQNLKRGALLDQLGPDCMCDSVEEAVLAVKNQG
jgi:hypothetical protein